MMNAFIGLPSATLTTLQTSYVQAITDIATTGQSIAIPGRTLSRSNLTELQQALANINEAIASASGSRRKRATFRFGGV